MYKLVRPFLFRLDPETSHDFTLELLEASERLRLLPKLGVKVPQQPKELMGLSFKNPVGLAAGLDKNGDCFNALGRLGFGFVEIGTITPMPQPGNPKPRMFRLEEHEAIINRMGFNNKGVNYLVERVKHRRYDGVLGINIGKNKDTPEEKALQDYTIAMTAVYPFADYITVNISSPNTPGLRNLQFGESLKNLLEGLKEQQTKLAKEHDCYKPVVVKIAPDMDEVEIKAVSKTLLNQGIDGVIATNTTIDHTQIKGHLHGEETGGLSGAPVTEKSTEVISQLRSHCPKLPIIGVGGIMQGSDAIAKIEAGADLVQLYSGLIYRGPQLISEVRTALLEAQ